jgi:hypothetical protein
MRAVAVLPAGGRSGSSATSTPAGQGGSAAVGGAAGAPGVVAGSGAAGTAAAAGTSGAAGSGDAVSGEFLGASRCADSGFLVCDSFEADSIDSALWKPTGKVSIDSTRAARGGKSLHVTTGATGYSYLTTKKIFPAAMNRYYGRLFAYFSPLPTTPTWAHWTIVGASSDKSDDGEIRVGGQFDGKINRFGVGTDHGPTGDWTNLDNDPKGAPKAVPEGSWVCVEWLHDGATNETRFYWDGEEHASLATTPDVKRQGNTSAKYLLPNFSSLWVGFWNYDQGKSVTPDHFDVWIDEVALDDQRIGCTK